MAFVTRQPSALVEVCRGRSVLPTLSSYQPCEKWVKWDFARFSPALPGPNLLWLVVAGGGLWWPVVACGRPLHCNGISSATRSNCASAQPRTREASVQPHISAGHQRSAIISAGNRYVCMYASWPFWFKIDSSIKIPGAAGSSHGSSGIYDGLLV